MLHFITRPMKRHGKVWAITTDGLRSHRAALDELGFEDKQDILLRGLSPPLTTAVTLKARSGTSSSSDGTPPLRARIELSALGKSEH